nr:putative ribonuclease H-like domain-containing protein [Tanacetum cinerariifolium]
MIMNQFCEMKGIEREFSVARTLQQNGVVKRKNRTLIDDARTMLADSKLPTTLWAEAVNTACYIQNRVLVIKPHNKTSYELFLGRKPILSIMRPFSSKDSSGAGFKLSGEEEMKDAKDPGNEDSEGPSTEESRVNQEKDENVNNTNNINTVSLTDNAAGIENNAVDENIVYGCADDPNLPELEDISIFEDSNGDVFSAEADLNNLESTFQVSPIPITRIHKYHPLQQVIGDQHSAPQTRRMIKNLEEYGLVSTVNQRTNHKYI